MRKWKVAVLLLAVSCTSRPERNSTLDKAHQVHLEAIDLYARAHHLYDSLKKDAGKREEKLFVSRLDSIHDIMHHWEEGLYEIPGYAHSGHDGHAHKHEHKTAPKMTDQSMLDYQENAKQAVLEIKERLEEMVNQP